jgi:hypothetical protein
MNGSSVIGCLNSARQRAYLKDLHGRPKPPKQKSRHSEIDLPLFVPQIFTGLGDMTNFKGRPLFAVSMTTILSKEGKVQYRSAASLRRDLRIASDARLMLIGTASDYTIDKLWKSSDATDAWKRIANLGFECSTGLSYSVWDAHPKFDQIFNQEKNETTYDLLLSQGLISIPFLFSYDERDYQAVLSWLKAHKDVRKVAILAQFKRHQQAFDEVVKEMHRLQRDVSRPLHFFVVGPSTARKIKRLLDEFPNVTVAIGEPASKALYNHRTRNDLSHVPADMRIAKSTLVKNNVEMYRQFCLRAKRAKRARRYRSEPPRPLFSRISV